jgi:proline iminopeptidase
MTIPAALSLVILLATAPLPADAAGDAVADVANVHVGDARLWILMRGDDRAAPVMIWLHGGPGGAQTPLFRLFNRDLERHFVVVYWDQRGAGRSFDPDADPSALTIRRHLEDLDAVIGFVRGRTGVDEVALVGHSWGAALGLLYAHDQPGKVSAVVAAAPLVNELERQHAQLAFALASARDRDDEQALSTIREIGTPPFTAEQVLAMERWVDRYGGVFHNRPSFLRATVSATVRGYVRPWEIPRFIRANELTLQVMMPELLTIDLRTAVPSLQVPVLFALGRHDRQVDARLAADYFAELAAPSRQLVWFEHSAHNVPFEEPERFNATVRAFLLQHAGVAPHRRRAGHDRQAD